MGDASVPRAQFAVHSSGRTVAGLGRHHMQVVKQIIAATFLLVAVVFAGKQFLGTARLLLVIEGQPRTFEGRVVPGMTALDALNASVLAGKVRMRFSIDTRAEQALIWTLDGYESQTRPVPLRVLINDRLVDPSALHRVSIGSGDTIAVHVVPVR